MGGFASPISYVEFFFIKLIYQKQNFYTYHIKILKHFRRFYYEFEKRKALKNEAFSLVRFFTFSERAPLGEAHLYLSIGVKGPKLSLGYRSPTDDWKLNGK